MRLLLSLGFLIILSGCATVGRNTEAYLATSPRIPVAIELREVPFIEQTENFCGPASLAMIMNWAGKSTSLDEAGKQIYTPGKAGAFQEDILGAGRREGLLSLSIHGVPALIEELASGHPVIIFENLGFSWFPKWHYAVVVGYDLNERKFIIHSGSHAFKRITFAKLETDWTLADSWGAVILPPTEISTSADDLDQVAAASVLEKMGKATEAQKIYKNILNRWPNSIGSLIGLGNIYYAAGNYKGAVRFLSRATISNPSLALIWHNLATAQGAAHMNAQARASAHKAIELVDTDTATVYRESLKDWL